MQTREILLHCLNDTVNQMVDLYRGLPDPNVLVNEAWSAKDILAHLTFWHESFAQNVDDLTHHRKPKPLKGRFIDLNQGGVDAMRPETLETVLERFLSAHRNIQENILSPELIFIPYKKGSRDYTPEEHLSIVEAHIRQHMRDIKTG